MTLTDTRKALQDILEEATATDCAVCYVTDADEETLRSAIQAIDDMKKMQGMLKTAVDEIEKLMKNLCHATTPDSKYSPCADCSYNRCCMDRENYVSFADVFSRFTLHDVTDLHHVRLGVCVFQKLEQGVRCDILYCGNHICHLRNRNNCCCV